MFTNFVVASLLGAGGAATSPTGSADVVAIGVSMLTSSLVPGFLLVTGGAATSRVGSAVVASGSGGFVFDVGRAFFAGCLRALRSLPTLFSTGDVSPVDSNP